MNTAEHDFIEKEILVSLAGYGFKVVKFKIFITFTISRFNGKKSRSSQPKICKIICKSPKSTLFLNIVTTLSCFQILIHKSHIHFDSAAQ